MEQLMTVFTIAITVGAYIFSRFLYMKYGNPLFNVVLLGTAIVIAVLVFSNISYEAYRPGQDIMTFLLGPATVALAVPLYKNRLLLRQYAVAICVSVGVGSLVSMTTAMFIAKLGGMGKEVIISIAPKSVTAPIAVEIANITGGDPALAVAFVVATGTLGSVVGMLLLTWFKVNNAVARGLAMGTVAHAQGTAISLMEGNQQGAMAGVAMALAAIFSSAVAPYVIALFL